jgi:hypothetical protein
MLPLSLLLALSPDTGPVAVLSNASVRAEFSASGLAVLTDRGSGRQYRFERDGFAIVIDGQTYRSDDLAAPRLHQTGTTATYAYTAGARRIEIEYELRPSWKFLSKRLLIAGGPAETFRVGAVSVLDGTLGEAPASWYVPRNHYPRRNLGDYGVTLRFGDGHGLIAVVQNPFLRTERDGARLAIRYDADMPWSPADGPFESDRALLGPHRLSGRRLPATMVPEWSMTRADTSAGMDQAEVDAFTAMVRAFLLPQAERPLNVFVGWTANDYQIDVALPEGRAEYLRLFDQAAAVGAEYVLYGPSNSALSRREASLDDWSWEHVLWLGLGQKLRSGAWDPSSGEIPPTVREMLDAAATRRLKLLAYVYPVLPFAGNPAWLVPARNNPRREYANLGIRSYQDWLIETLLTFHRRTGIGGYSFDHTFLQYDGASPYAQWAGWRRVMEALRRRIPDIVIDGRQAYQEYGPWSWLAGSYPHPTSHDEQPESFAPFPDLHFDRVSANRQRYTAWRYRNHDFAPNEIVPGYMTHQTSRSDTSNRMPQVQTVDRGAVLTSFRARDWDYLGWRYSVLSSIATGGWNNVISLLPARDSAEFAAFGATDQAWLRGWLDWTRENREYLRHTRPILGQPALGRIDGTSAIIGDRGYVFLFNPNGRRLTATVALDKSIGLEHGSTLILTEMYPLSGRRIAKPDEGVWRRGDRVEVELDGGSVLAFGIAPTETRRPDRPALFGAPGEAEFGADGLRVTGVVGEVGTTAPLAVLIPPGRRVGRLFVNGREMPFATGRPGVITAKVRFAGAPFRHYQQVGSWDSTFIGGRFTATITVPEWVNAQLEARRRAWPIPWTEADFQTTWLVPDRLLLFVQIAEPDERWEASLRIDGHPVELVKAYSAVRRVLSTFVGFYADVSGLAPGVEHRIELVLPPLKPGQFQGLFFENVETQYTDSLAPDQP